MIGRSQYMEVQAKAIELIQTARLYITPAEREKIAVADFGLSDIYSEGIQVLTFFETDRIAGKILVLLPNQTEPEHWHPPVGNDPRKQETTVRDGLDCFTNPGIVRETKIIEKQSINTR